MEEVRGLSFTRLSALWGRLGAGGDPAPVFERLRAAYDEPHRAYHTAVHIQACLDLLDDPEVRALPARFDEVEAALWFHDAIYDTHAPDNEEKSAVLADETLRGAGLDADMVGRIAQHVLATKGHVSDSIDGRLVIDVDLSILGQDRATFARFEDEIRREYAWVPAPDYAAGRAHVLRRFEERAAIFALPFFRERFEAKARQNIAWARQRLGA